LLASLVAFRVQFASEPLESAFELLSVLWGSLAPEPFKLIVQSSSLKKRRYIQCFGPRTSVGAIESERCLERGVTRTPE